MTTVTMLPPSVREWRRRSHCYAQARSWSSPPRPCTAWAPTRPPSAVRGSAGSPRTPPSASSGVECGRRPQVRQGRRGCWPPPTNQQPASSPPGTTQHLSPLPPRHHPAPDHDRRGFRERHHVTIAIALGGSTKAVLHLIAMADVVGVPLGLDDFTHFPRLEGTTGMREIRLRRRPCDPRGVEWGPLAVVRDGDRITIIDAGAQRDHPAEPSGLGRRRATRVRCW